MARLLRLLLVLGLLAATAAAFAFTERLKLEKSPVTGTRVDSVFSPVCRCRTDVARIAFRLPKPDLVTLSIVDATGRPVRTLFTEKRIQGLHHFTWNGRDDEGHVLPEGRYHVRIQLSDLDRTFVPPNPIAVDTTPPQIHPLKVRPAVFSPDGDHRADGIVLGYVLSEPASTTLFVNGRRRVETPVRTAGGQLHWYGRVDGRSFAAGAYRLQVVARDRAGNVSAPVSAGTVHIRYIRIVEPVIEARAGHRARVYVSTDARPYRWRVGKQTGTARKRLLLLPLLKPGRYRLVVEANRHRAVAHVVVHKRRG